MNAFGLVIIVIVTLSSISLLLKRDDYIFSKYKIQISVNEIDFHNYIKDNSTIEERVLILTCDFLGITYQYQYLISNWNRTLNGIGTDFVTNEIYTRHFSPSTYPVCSLKLDYTNSVCVFLIIGRAALLNCPNKSSRIITGLVSDGTIDILTTHYYGSNPFTNQALSRREYVIHFCHHQTNMKSLIRCIIDIERNIPL